MATVLDTGMLNLWAGDTVCDIKKCLVCERRGMKAAEKELMALKKVKGEIIDEGVAGMVDIVKGDMIVMAGCTKEGITYVLECYDCRIKGIWKHYIGETLGLAMRGQRNT